MRRGLLICSLLALAATSGCRNTPATSRVATYFENRGRDFAAAFPASVGFGPGVLVEVRATKFFQTGLGAAMGTKRWGWGNRTADRHGHWPEYGNLGLVVYFLRIDEDDDDLRWSGNKALFFPFGVETQSASVFEVDAQLGIVGLRLGFDPLMLGDALAGLFGFDPAGNDRTTNDASTEKEAPKSQKGSETSNR